MSQVDPEPRDRIRDRGNRVHLLLDACTVINVYACRRMLEIFEAEPLPVAVVDAVKMESLFVFSAGKSAEPREREPINLDPAVDAGLLQVITPTETELTDFIDLTLHFKGDGEAMTIAVALARRWPIVTDDRKAIRLIGGRTEVQSSLALLKGWFERAAVNDQDQRQIARDLRDRGNYFPGVHHPLRAWWDTLLGGW